jgi:hypothetical protein
MSDIVHRDYDSLAAINRREAIARRYDIPFDEVIYAGMSADDYQVISYLEQRETLWYAIEIIAQARKEHTEEVWPIFLRAQFTGDTSEIEQLVNTHFGANGYKIFEHMDITSDSASSTFTELKKIRSGLYGDKD